MIGNNYLHSNITKKVIRAYYNVYNILGYGFLEKVYENALLIELRKQNLKCESQRSIEVYYDNQQVGLYYADIVVESKVIIELKAAEILTEEHEIQLVNYLKATDAEVGLLLIFGREAELSRKVLSNEFKKHKLTVFNT